MKEIPLTRGRVALVDDEDYEMLSRWKWGLSSNGFACRSVHVGGHRSYARMHRVLTLADEGIEVDHINGDKTDNRRCNLRLCSHADNQHNQPRYANSRTGYKGVYQRQRVRRPKWFAQIKCAGRIHYLGTFSEARAAARAYDEAALRLHGAFAHLNF